MREKVIKGQLVREKVPLAESTFASCFNERHFLGFSSNPAVVGVERTQALTAKEEAHMCFN